LALLAPLLFFVRLTAPAWYPGELRVEKSLDSQRSKFSFKPNLLGKPDQVLFSAQPNGEEPIYLTTAINQYQKRYLLTYPNEDNYQKVFTQGDLTVWSQHQLTQQSGDLTIEKFISQLPRKYSLEMDYSVIRQRAELAEENKNLIDLTAFYRTDIKLTKDRINRRDLNLVAANFRCFTFLTDSLELKIKKHDLNQKLGRDDLYLLIFGPDDQLVKVVKLEDDNQPPGRLGDQKTATLSLGGLAKGVYSFEFVDLSGGDVIIDQFSLNSPYFVIERETIPSLATIGKLYQPEPESEFLSFSPASYFYPFQRRINQPGSQSDILLYRSIDSLDLRALGLLGQLDFTLINPSGQRAGLNKLKIKYLY
jgi:hypothetical protein